MLLPCPHCRRQFKLHAERIRSERARIKCPACEGVFVLNLVASSPPAAGSAMPMHSRPPREDCGGKLRGNDAEESHGSGVPLDCHLRGNDAPPSVSPDAHTSPAIATATARHALNRDSPRFLLFWTLVPACSLLLALAGILLSGPWVTTQAPPVSPLRAGIGTEEALSSSVSSHPDTSRQREGPYRESDTPIIPPSRSAENLMERAFWSLPSDPNAPCDVLLRSQAGVLGTQEQDTCKIYPLWIAYLILETAPTPVCEVEPTFAFAANALQKETLCGQGLAFLCTYYLKKGLLDRSQSFLDQALRQAPDDPWVKLVEAVFYEQAYYDDQRAISILEGLSRQDASFSLVGYILGKAYIREEQYKEANAAFESLKEDAMGQIAFWRIRRALSSLEQTADQRVEKAEALLALSRAFAALKDYSMAQDLYRWVLEEMPGRLPKRARMAAYCELGDIYERRGDNSSAYDSYRNALEIDPAFPAAREGIEALLPDQANRS